MGFRCCLLLVFLVDSVIECCFLVVRVLFGCSFVLRFYGFEVIECFDELIVFLLVVRNVVIGNVEKVGWEVVLGRGLFFCCVMYLM